jgi:hypothetical protein
MSSLRDPLIFSCTNCEAPILGSVTFFVGLPFCCAGCVAGGPCTCSYDAEPGPVPPPARSVIGHARASSAVADVSAAVEEPAVTEEPLAAPVPARRSSELVRVG